MLKDVWERAVACAKSIVPETNDSAIQDGIMMWIAVAVVLAVFLPVVNSIFTATPTIVTNPLDVGNLSDGGGVLGSSMMNTTQVSTMTMVGSSYGLLIVVLIVLAAVILLGVIAYLRQR